MLLLLLLLLVVLRLAAGRGHLHAVSVDVLVCMRHHMATVGVAGMSAARCEANIRCMPTEAAS
jgi:hypothetical protein